METYIHFLILIAFGCMVWAGGVTIMHLMVCRELDALKREAKNNKERAEFYSGYSDRRDAEVKRLEKEVGRLGTDLLLARGYVQRLRVKAGEITPDGRSLRLHRRVVSPLSEFDA